MLEAASNVLARTRTCKGKAVEVRYEPPVHEHTETATSMCGILKLRMSEMTTK